MKRFTLVATAFATTVLVSACGGGGGGRDDPQATPIDPGSPTGQWEGTSSTNRKLEGFVLEDGSYYVFYSRAGQNSVLGGFIQGVGVADRGSFSSDTAHDFNVESRSVTPGTASATYFGGQTLAGNFTYEGGDSFTFDTTYDTIFNKTPTLTAFAGEYAGSLVSTLGTEDVTIKALDTGTISATTPGGCTLTGSATPRSEGYAFDVSITFGGEPCLFGDKTLQGMAYLHPTKRLYLAVSDAEKTSGLLFFTQKNPNQ